MTTAESNSTRPNILTRFLDAAPLIEIVEARARGLAFEGEISPASTLLDGRYSPLAAAYRRAVRDGRLTERAADQLACHLGEHPALIWGEAWWDLPDSQRRPVELRIEGKPYLSRHHGLVVW